MTGNPQADATLSALDQHIDVKPEPEPEPESESESEAKATDQSASPSHKKSSIEGANHKLTITTTQVSKMTLTHGVPLHLKRPCFRW